MNEKAKAMNMVDTEFHSVHGLRLQKENRRISPHVMTWSSYPVHC